MHKKLPVLDELINKKAWAMAAFRFAHYYEKQSSNHWYMFQYARVLNAIGKYDAEITKKALELNPKCPENILHISNIYIDNGVVDTAYDLIKPISDNELNDIMVSDCFSGIGWARSIHNDSRFILAKCLIAKDLRVTAKRYAKMHVEGRVRGRRSIFSTQAANELLRSLSDV